VVSGVSLNFVHIVDDRSLINFVVSSAIIGASGSGKTTLLNALAHRLDILSMVRTGDIRINGKEYDNDFLKSHTGYVMQEDILQPRFTVYETLYYHAAFRLSSTLSSEEREKRINEILVVLNLEHTRDVLIGDSRHKGISGGERKRVAVAVELIARPKILFLDEPTSGLDSTTSLHLIQALRTISDSGRCSIITTIHQPQEKIFELFNKIILLRNGEITYQGNPREAVLYFTNLGYVLGEDENPADFLVNIVSQGSYDPVTGAAVALPFANSAKALSKDVDITLGKDAAPLPPKSHLGWHYQLGYLFRRDLLLLSRSLDIVFLGIIAEVVSVRHTLLPAIITSLCL
jgi:ATP-binding cassette, subfamily G (WHITE), member 2